MRNKKKGIGLLLAIFLSMDPGIALAEDWSDESSGIEKICVRNRFRGFGN